MTNKNTESYKVTLTFRDGRTPIILKTTGSILAAARFRNGLDGPSMVAQGIYPCVFDRDGNDVTTEADRIAFEHR